MQSKTQTAKQLLQNIIFIFFPREAGGNFLKNLVELGLFDSKEQKQLAIQKIQNHLESNKEHFFHTETGNNLNTAGFVEKIKNKIDNNTKNFVFCDQYYTFQRHQNFFKIFNIQNFIIITCLNSNEELNKRRLKLNTPTLTDEEIQLNNIFPTFMKQNYKQATIVSIEYKDLLYKQSFLDSLDKINKKLNISIPVNDCEKLISFYLTNKIHT